MLPSVFVLYTGYRYGWDARQVGCTLAVVGVCSGIVQGGLVRPVVQPARRAHARWSSACCSAPSVSRSTGSRPPASGSGGHSGDGAVGPRPAPRPGHHDAPRRASEQGQLQGANSSIVALAGMIGPGLFTQAFARSIARRAGISPAPRSCWPPRSLLAATALAWRVTRKTEVAG